MQSLVADQLDVCFTHFYIGNVSFRSKAIRDQLICQIAFKWIPCTNPIRFPVQASYTNNMRMINTNFQLCSTYQEEVQQQLVQLEEQISTFDRGMHDLVEQIRTSMEHVETLNNTLGGQYIHMEDIKDRIRGLSDRIQQFIHYFPDWLSQVWNRLQHGNQPVTGECPSYEFV